MQSAQQSGKNMSVFAKDMTLHFRNLLVVKSCTDYENMLGLTKVLSQKMKAQAEQIAIENLMEYMKIFSSIESEIKYALSPRALIETAIVTAISEVGELKINEF